MGATARRWPARHSTWAMEAVLIGAPGSGARGVARALAERRGARFVDLTGDPARRPDVVSGVRLAEEPDAGPALRRVIAADRIVADTALRARLFRGRHVIWLDVPADQLVERLRAVRRADLEIRGRSLDVHVAPSRRVRALLRGRHPHRRLRLDRGDDQSHRSGAERAGRQRHARPPRGAPRWADRARRRHPPSESRSRARRAGGAPWGRRDLPAKPRSCGCGGGHGP